MNELVPCAVCEAPVTVTPSRLARGKKFCSRECQGKARAERYRVAGTKRCPQCGAEFRSKFGLRSTYCSVKCAKTHHYFTRRGDPRELLLSRIAVDDATGCWNWTGDRRGAGYGRAFWAGKVWAAHRLSFIAFKGDIADSLFVCHHCDNPPCINPDHLFAGTSQDNHRDMEEKGRIARGERHGMSKLSDEAVREIIATFNNPHTAFDLADKFGVSFATIYLVANRKRWSHVQ